ncbi:MAG: DUF1016 family protein [Bacteroidetes bacterium]|nr:MAG: DUF1016 family protein [Bacteroidota bacterium]
MSDNSDYQEVRKKIMHINFAQLLINANRNVCSTFCVSPNFFKFMENKLIPNDYAQTLLAIKKRIKEARFLSFKAINTELILMYLEIGKVIYNKLATGWGEAIVDKLSIDLQNEFSGVKGFSPRNIRRMKLIYEQCLKNEFWTQLVSKIPWGHTNLIFAKIKQAEQITFYLQKCIERGWSRSILEEEIRFDAYQKAMQFQNNFPKTIDQEKLIEYRLEFRDEYNLSFLELAEVHTERELENALVNNITKTLGHFGNDFAFMGRQFRLELDNKEYFVDLLFYHRKLKCMVALELKATEFKPEHSQQLNWYLHLLDKTVKYEDDKASIGIFVMQKQK